ncbi:glycosyltransferase family 4 protein [Arthrobacter sp. EH-1B-1]|uniref:Glycosyltransferase family 4 protein n=1 Tax=Arthrobacter vasquezii TaxID=2977629 RepID=A0ABT6CXS2_9MICC|nr:glycosyltransferase family 4 protein [Arthrobacter vasquezii]MDF9278668.1 glycosyltransferase family 4 protein [Arthrobacter vasquezii]
MQLSNEGRVGYVLKIYPRFSETFIVTEILAREAAGEDLEIFSLRPPVDPRFHPELARVKAPVTYVARPQKLSEGWPIIAAAHNVIPNFAQRFAALLPDLAECEASEVHQGVELATRVTERGITHLHAHFGSIAARTARIASALTGVPFSFTAHAKDIYHEQVDQAELIRLIQAAHHTVTVSDFNYRYLSTLAPAASGRLHRVYNGLELSRFHFREPAPVHMPFRIAAVGRLVEKKGFSLLIDAVAALVRSGVQVDVRIAGGGELADSLADRVRLLGLSDQIHLLGPRTQSEVIELLRWADVFAAPCIIGADGNADGLPTVLLEAMAMGVVCIGSDVTGIPEVLGGMDGAATGLLVRAGNVEDLILALRTTASDSFDRTATALAARSLIERCFDSRSQSAQLQRLCGTAAAEADPPVRAEHPSSVSSSSFTSPELEAVVR